ncbi:competence protein CoiA [Metabacillus litoralis]|uniref:competence protein CoiA n=1 Tax=Metabacillus litoralis TaxID=152268 RepID=UPI001CFD4057|nr:competence protein CoiA family protein [Metabacillus litoralis]
MFIAYDQQGNKVNLAERRWSSTTLKKLKTKSQFICTSCSSELDLKIGTVITPHFAHKKLTGCSGLESGAESEYHRKGKLDLYHWLQKQKTIPSVSLEPFISSIKQRPDLLVNFQEKQVAIEFQCAKIDHKLIRKRSTEFQKEEIEDLWILGANSIKRTGSLTFQLTGFQWLLIHTYKQNKPPIIIAYCPDQKMFIKLQNIIPFSQRSIIAQATHTSLHSTTLSQLFREFHPTEQLIQTWLNKIKGYRLHSSQFKTKQTHALNIFLYKTKRLPLSSLPSLAFLPLSTNYLIESPVFIWQGWILFFIDQLKLRTIFSFRDVYYFIENKIKAGLISIRRLLHKNLHYSYVLKSYLLKLCHLSVIKETDKNMFMKEKQLDWKVKTEDLLKSDQELLSKYKLL